MWFTHVLSMNEVDDVTRLAAAARAADGVGPLNEEATLRLRGERNDTWHLLDRDPTGELRGYAQVQSDLASAQVVVDPSTRGQGIGSGLLAAVLDVAGPDVQVWAFGGLPAALAVARTAGLTVSRSLLMMELPDITAGLASVPHLALLAGVRVATWTNAYADPVLALNAHVFVDHPEQGQMSKADLEARMAEPWFDPSAFFLAWDARGLAGFHWTKRHDDATGEVYVIASRRPGLGRVLLRLGLDMMSQKGCRRAILYVDSDNHGAIHMYENTGFRIARRDVCFTRTGPNQSARSHP